MTIDEALLYFKEHQQEFTGRIYRGKYTPSPLRRVEIPEPDGGVRKLGIPEHYAATIANSRRKDWYISNNKAVTWALNKERLINSGFYDLATTYQSVHVNY